MQEEDKFRWYRRLMQLPFYLHIFSSVWDSFEVNGKECVQHLDFIEAFPLWPFVILLILSESLFPRPGVGKKADRHPFPDKPTPWTVWRWLAKRADREIWQVVKAFFRTILLVVLLTPPVVFVMSFFC